MYQEFPDVYQNLQNFHTVFTYEKSDTLIHWYYGISLGAASLHVTPASNTLGVHTVDDRTRTRAR